MLRIFGRISEKKGERLSNKTNGRIPKNNIKFLRMSMEVMQEQYLEKSLGKPPIKFLKVNLQKSLRKSQRFSEGRFS